MRVFCTDLSAITLDSIMISLNPVAPKRRPITVISTPVVWNVPNHKNYIIKQFLVFSINLYRLCIYCLIQNDDHWFQVQDILNWVGFVYDIKYSIHVLHASLLLEYTLQFCFVHSGSSLLTCWNQLGIETSSIVSLENTLRSFDTPIL